MNVELMDAIEFVGSRLEKERLLRRETDTRFLRWALDPAIVFGVTVDPTEMVVLWTGAASFERLDPASWWDRVDRACRDLSTRSLTGHAARDAVRTLMASAPTPTHVNWACRVLNKNLSCGVQVTTANAVFPGLVVPFECMLADKYRPEKHSSLGGWYVQPKVDGLRMLIVDGVPLTRNGRVIESVGHILEELRYASKEFVFDGEVVGAGDFNESSGATRRKGAGPNQELHYHVFDVVPHEQWDSRQTQPLSERCEDYLREYFWRTGWARKHVSCLEWRVLGAAPDHQDVVSARDGYISQGFEGVMLKDPAAPYRWGRTGSVLKFKRFESEDCRVVGHFEGRGRHKGRLGGVIVERTAGGPTTRVGSGFSDRDRDELWAARDSLVGRVAETEYQDLSKDGVMRFPTFSRWRPDKE